MDVLAIPKINTKGTMWRVKDFFKRDYPGICRRAGNNPTGIRAVIIDGMPKSQASGNNAENKITEYIENQVEYEKVVNAIKSLDMWSQDIITYDVIENRTVKWCSGRLHMTRSRYLDYKRYALNAFADAYEYQTFGEIDLHEYE